METKIALTYKVSLAKTRFVLQEDGSYKMGSPMITFDGPEFLTEKLAQDYISLRIKEEKKTAVCNLNAAGVDHETEVISDRMLKIKAQKVIMLYTYSVVTVSFGFLGE